MTHKITKIGVITNAHGIRGEVTIRPLIDDVKKLSSVTDESGSRLFSLKFTGKKGDLLIASIKGIEDRNEAERLKNTVLYAMVKSDDALTYKDLLGFDARTSNGKIYGKVTGTFNFGAGDIIELELPSGKSEMLPFTENYIGKIHEKEHWLEVFPPEYVEAKDE